LGGYGKEFFGSYLESKRSIYKELKKNKKKWTKGINLLSII
jgi:hypothetical protein